jgi:MFS family permease
MGIITGILPFTFLLTKPFFGLLFDVYRQYRKIIFLSLIITMTLSFGAIYFLPSRPLLKFNLKFFNYTSSGICDNATPMVCNSTCLTKTTSFLDTFEIKRLCALPSSHLQSEDLNCYLTCTEQPEPNLYKTLTFWAFIIFISVATIGFNVVNSISDAVCFDVVGMAIANKILHRTCKTVNILENQELYGKQRLWGSIGFGLTGLISGYMVDLVSAKSLKYIPAFVTMTTCSIFDLFVCLKLEVSSTII